MAEALKTDRVIFPKGAQKTFLEQTLLLLKITSRPLAKELGICQRTLNDWKREKFSMSLVAARKICQLTNQNLPETCEIRDQWWYVHKGARKGYDKVIQKYGRMPIDKEHRQKKWREWWEGEGKTSWHQRRFSERKTISYPRKSTALAELCGILLGDGGISTYQVIVTLHSEDDKEYGQFVSQLFEKLFHVQPKLYISKKFRAFDITISRIELVEHCLKLGLVAGNKIKQKIDIPGWIKENPTYLRACIKGLVDTDGSIYTHTYRVNRKIYSYKKLSFCSASEPLRLTVFKGLRELGLKPRIAQDRDVRLENSHDTDTYMRVIGSHNPKHVRRYES